MNAHEVVVAIYELSLAHARRKIMDYPESDPRNKVLAADIEWTERKLKQVKTWNDAWQIHRQEAEAQYRRENGKH